MDEPKTYCTAIRCPFKDCEHHLCRVRNLATEGTVSVASMYRVCRRYVGWLVRECDKEGAKLRKMDIQLKNGKTLYINENDYIDIHKGGFDVMIRSGGVVMAFDTWADMVNAIDRTKANWVNDESKKGK